MLAIEEALGVLRVVEPRFIILLTTTGMGMAYS